jgi:hypothetical protein
MHPEFLFEIHPIMDVQDPTVVKVSEAEVIRRILHAIPDHWGATSEWGGCGFVSGSLRAPAGQVRDGCAQEGTRLRLGDFDGGYPFAVSAADKIRERVPDLAALFLEKKDPEVIEFDLAGYLPRNKQVSLKVALQFIRYYVARGYRGHLRIVSGGYHGQLHKNPAVCDLQLAAWKGTLSGEEGDQPPRVLLSWNQNLGGKREDHFAVERCCRLLGLTQYKVTRILGYYPHYTQLELDLGILLVSDTPLAAAAA